MCKLQPWARILVALLLAVFVGLALNRLCAVERDPKVVLNAFGSGSVAFFGYLGALFMQALKMIIVPLVFSSVVVGIAGLGQTKGFGRMGVKTLVYYVTTSLLAILIGLALVNWIQPGLVDGKPNERIRQAISSNETDYAAAAAKSVAGQDTEGLDSVGDIFKRTVPENIFAAFADNNQMLALIFVSMLVGFGLIFMGGTGRATLLGFFEALNELALLVTGWIMLLAPVGVFGLVAKTVALTGFETFGMLGKYFLVVLAGLLFHFLVVLPLILRTVGRVRNPYRHFRAMRNPLLTAFSTASSSATLPVTMRAVRENAGVSNRVSSFVLPLGATVNMDGTALYECVAVLFIAQILGWDLSAAQQFMVVALALLTSIGVAGIPSASLVAITVIVNNVGIPNSEAVIGFLLAVDRVLDMSRTAVNIFSDTCGAVIIAKSEGEEGILENVP